MPEQPDGHPAGQETSGGIRLKALLPDSSYASFNLIPPARAVVGALKRRDATPADAVEVKRGGGYASVLERLSYGRLYLRAMTTTEIVNMLALDFHAVSAVPDRSRRIRKSHEEEADELLEELAPEEEESEDEDAGEDDYNHNPFAYRGKIAGGEL